ncbi:unnamed protein product, partial [Mesorhabditis belari]|uniref:Saposin B-type domain-containing protein n=1 Tax=Mesorhabditis belari TaxID=2138241 RepID=A0AAF3EDJ2_9BILA
MSSRIYILFGIFLISFGVHASNTYCHDCQLMINQCKSFFKNDFRLVTSDELLKELTYLCDQSFAGYDNTQCKTISNANVGLILSDLKNGISPSKICAHIQMC